MHSELITDAIILPLLLVVLKKNKQHLHLFKFDYLYEEYLTKLMAIIQTDLLSTKRTMYQTAKIRVDKIKQTTDYVAYQIHSIDHHTTVQFTPEQLKNLTEDYLRYYLFKGDHDDDK